jgi:uncharacterized peroxidase-related enzyme
MIRLMTRDPHQPLDIVKTVMYRPAFFGKPYSSLVDVVMRGPSSWTIAERELFAAFVSSKNECQFWTGSHGAVASIALGETGDTVTQAVLADWRTAPIDDKLKAMLGYLEKLTLSPADIQPADVAALTAAGIEKQAMLEAIYVCALFNMIDRIADALNFAIPPSFIESSTTLLKRGYDM